MMYLDKDMERVMQKKKRDVINELEAYKNKILQELSGVDKLTLTRLRQILADYNHIKASIDSSTEKFNSVSATLDEKLSRFDEEIQKKLSDVQIEFDSIIGSVGELAGLENVKILYADKYCGDDGNIDSVLELAESGEYTRFGRVIIKLGAGNYTFSKQFNPVKCIVIEGCGSTMTRLTYTGTDNPAVEINGVDEAGLRGLALYGGDIDNRVDGVVINPKAQGSQTGGQVLEDLWIRYFATGLRINSKVFTLRATYIRIYECTGYGIYNTGTDNQFLYICTQGCNLGNIYEGSNNAYDIVYSIFDGRTGTYSNYLGGTRNHFSQFTTQDSYMPLVFNNFVGTFYGQFDAIYHSNNSDYYEPPNRMVKIANKSIVNGELRIASYRTETIPYNTIEIDESSIFNGRIPHDIFTCPKVEGVINDDKVKSEIENPYKNRIDNLGFSYTSKNNGQAIYPTTGYTDEIKRNGFMPDPNSTWIFTGRVRKEGNATALKVFNDSGEGEAYASQVIVDLTKIPDNGTASFWVAIHREGDRKVCLMVDGLTEGDIVIEDLKAYDVTGLGVTSKRYFSNPSCYSALN